MKKLFGLGKKKKSGPSPCPSESGSVLSVGYELKEKELSKLHRAASTGDSSKIRQLLPKNDINQLDKENRTPLHLACANGHPDAVKLLVENKAKLNLGDNDSRTPLIKAIQCQHEHCATILLDHDADPNIVDVNGNAALHLAALIPSMTVAIQLLEHGANIDAVNKEGCTPLVLTVCENHQDMVEFLLKEGASVNSKDKKGRTPLMIAAGNGQISLVKYLLQSNADIFIKDETGWTADDHAVMNGHHACSHLIIEHGSKNKHSTSLYGAAKKGASAFSSPDRAVEGGFTLGSPAVNKDDWQVTSKRKPRKKDSEKGTDEYSQDDSESRVSGKADSWASSDEDDLDFSPKKTSKPSLTQLLNTKKNDKTKTQACAKKSEQATNGHTGNGIGEIDVEDDEECVEGSDHCEESEALDDEEEECEDVENDDEEEECEDVENDDEEEECEDVENDNEEEECEDVENDNEEEECEDVENNNEEEECEDVKNNCEEEECEDVENDNEEEECEDVENDNEEEKEECEEEHDDGEEVSDSGDEEEEPCEDHLKKDYVGPTDVLHENEDVDNLDTCKNDHGLTDLHSKENMDVVHYDVYHNLSQAKQDANYHPDCNDVPVSLIYGLPQSPDENVTSLIESDVTSLTTCIKACTQTEHLEVTSEKSRDNKEDSQSNEEVCAIKESPNPLGCQELTLDSDLKMSDPVCLQGTHGVIENHDESFSSSESEEDIEDGESPQHSFTADTAHQTDVHSGEEIVGRKVALMSELGFEDDESPWDSESASDSPRKHSASDIPAPAAAAHMQCISEESNEEVSEKSIAPEICKPSKTILQMRDGSSVNLLTKANEINSKSDLMADLGLDDADDIEDASDWDSTSHSLKYSTHTPRGGHSKLNENTLPQMMLDGSLPKGTAALSPMKLSSVQEDDSEEHMLLKKENVQSIPRDIPQTSQNIKNGFVNRNQITKDQDDIKVEKEKTTVNRQTELEKSIRNGDTPDLQEERNVKPTSKIKAGSNKEKTGRLGKENLKNASKSLFGQEGTKVTFRPQKHMGTEDHDDDTLSETSQKDGNRVPDQSVDEKSKVNDDDDMDDFSQSSVSVTEEYEAPTSSFRNAMLLIEQLNLEGQDSVNLLKIQTIIHEYERVIEKENRRHALLAQEVKKLREERKELQQITEKNRELKSLLEYNKVEWDSDVSSLRSTLKQEEEIRKSAEMLHDMSKEQLRRKEEQCRKEIEEKQQLELALRNMELEMRSLRNNMKQTEEERSEAQRLYTQEHNARLLQDETLNNLRRKIEEEESRKLLSKSVEQVLSQPSETNEKLKDLTQKNITLQDEIAILKQELEQVRSHYQEEESRYLDENEALKEKIDDLRKDLKVNEETLTQTVIQCNGQLNALKTETNMLCSKLEHEKQSKERLETELESLRSRLNSALQDVERSQASKTDTERTLQRERDEWLRSKDKLNHDLSNLRESNNNLSQQLSRTEAKLNSLENDLHRTGLSLQERSLMLESSQRDLTQAHDKVKKLEQELQIKKDHIDKSSIKQETIQERLAQFSSENMQLRQQLEDAQNKGIIKEKAVSDVQDRFTDIFSKLRADTERQIQIVEERNKDLINKSNELREQVYKFETEKVERESTIRQLQQELADALKKLSMSEASLEVITRYRNDLEEQKQQLHKEIEKFKTKVQDLEEQFLQSERRNHQLKNVLDDKEREVMAAFQKVQELSNGTAGTEKSVKQLEEHIQKLEIENAKFEATAKQQSLQIETLQKDLQESLSIRSLLEDLVTSLQTSKIGLEEKLNRHVQKQTVLSQNAQDSHNLWEEELKSRSRLGVRLAELDRSNADLVEQVENERKKVKKLIEHKKSMEERFDQEIKRNTDLQREVSGLKKLLKSTKKKLKTFEAGDHQTGNIKDGSHRGHQETDSEVFKLKNRIEELSSYLERESHKYMQLEASNRDLHEQLSSMKSLHKNHERLERSKRHLEDEVADLRRHIDLSKTDQSCMEQYKREIDERGRQELRQKLEEVNMFLQTQAASKDKLEQLRAEHDVTVRTQLEHRIQDLESELHKIKNIQEESMSQKDSTLSELSRVKDMYAEEQKLKKSLASKLERANERLEEANTKLLNERQRSKSLIASSFLNGSLNGGPLLDTSPLGGFGTSPALGRTLGLSGSFLSPAGSGLTANEMGAYFVKMQQELEKNITKELDQANAELDTGCTRVSPVGSNAGSMRNLNNDQDLVSQARQQYLEVLKKNYKI